MYGATLNRLIVFAARAKHRAESLGRSIALRCAYLLHRKGLSPQRRELVLTYCDPWPEIWASGIVWALDG